MNISKHRSANDLLYQAILSIQSVEECERFFEDLCSVSELQAMEQRFEVARLLYQGQMYSDILQETGASSSTISRVKRSLQYGSGGYTAVLPRLEGETADQEPVRTDPLS